MLPTYTIVEELIENGETDSWLVRAYLTGQRVLEEQLFKDMNAAEIGFKQFTSAKTFLEKEVTNGCYYDYAGAALFDSNNYTDSIKYFIESSKCSNLSSYGLYRYIVAQYRDSGSFTDIKTLPVVNDKSAHDWYCAGVQLDFFAKEEEWQGKQKVEIANFRILFYEQSYKLYYNYFFNNTGNSHAADAHYFAMCCNNYGIALAYAGRDEESIPIHTLGYKMSPFPEQLLSLGRTYLTLKKEEEAIECWERILRDFDDQLYFNQWFPLHVWYIESLYALGRFVETLEMSDNIAKAYIAFMKENEEDLDDYMKEQLEIYYNMLLHVRSCALIDSKVHPNTSAQIWEQQLAETPDNDTGYYHLFQDYFQQKEYKKALDCLANYNMIIAETEWDVDKKRNIYYKKGVSLIYTGKPEEGIRYVERSIELRDEIEIDFYTPFHFMYAYYSLMQWQNCIEQAEKCINIIENEGYKWDTEVAKVYMYYIDALKNTGRLTKALSAIQKTKEYNPQDAAAQIRAEVLDAENVIYNEYAEFADAFDNDVRAIEIILDKEEYEDAFIAIEKVTENYDVFIQLHKQDASKGYHKRLAGYYGYFQWFRERALDGLVMDNNEKVKKWESELRKYPDDATTLSNLSDLYYRTGQYEKSIDCISRYAEIWPVSNWNNGELVKYRYQSGVAYIFTGNHASGIKALQEAEKHLLEPDDFYTFYIPYYLCYGGLLNKDRTLSINKGKQAVELARLNNFSWDDDIAALYSWYADALYGAGDTNTALQIINEMLENEPENALALERKQLWHKDDSSGLFSLFKKKK